MNGFTPAAFEERATALFADNDRRPLAMQTRVAEAVATHGRVLVVQPTGGGKTLAAALPFATGFLAPKQMLFLTPLRALASQQAATLGYRLEGTPSTSPLDAQKVGQYLGLDPERAWDVSVQTGSEPTDPLFEADAVVCTFDQALSAALAISYSASMRRRTVNAGAFLTAYVVADELHLFPRDAALTTLLWFLRERPDLPFCLMTATLTTPTVLALADFLGATVVRELLSASDRATLGLTARTRTVSYVPRKLVAEDILVAWRAAHADGAGNVLVVVNTVERAIALGRQLHEDGTVPEDDLLVLHSRFYPEHRAAIERRLAARLGKESVRPPVIVIATQVVEVGLDISASHLLSDLAPANALVQRWGRCVRWGGTGTVRIFAPPEGEPAQAMPYAREDLGDVLTRTADWLIAHDGCLMDDATERALLDAAHGDDDQRWADGLVKAVQIRTRDVGLTIAEGDYSGAGKLIRTVDGRTVLVHGQPENIEKPFAHAGFRLSEGMLRRLLRRERGTVADDDDGFATLDLPPDIPWSLQALQPQIDRDADSERAADQRATWAPVAPNGKLDAPIYVLHPRLGSYDPRFGLSLSGAAAFGPVAPAYYSPLVGSASRRQWDQGGGLGRETLATHVGRMLGVLDGQASLWPHVTPAANAIERMCQWPPGMLRRVVEAAIVLHDIGKLTPAWQRMIRTYQQTGGFRYDPWLVHSDGPGRADWNPERLPHALTGAVYSLGVGAALDAEAGMSPALPSRVLFSAIATHHSPTLHNWALEARDLLDGTASAHASMLLSAYQFRPTLNEPVPGRPYLFDRVLPQEMLVEGDAAETFALLLVTRLLRLADGWSQEKGRLGL